MEEKLIGYLKCIEVKELPDGSCKIIFDYNEDFKKTYKEIFNLKRWSKKHFENLLEQAIKNMAAKIEEDKKCLELK